MDMDDERLGRLLETWTVPNAPARLENKVFGTHRPRRWISRLALAAALIAVVLAIFLRPARLSHFQPVDEVEITVVRSGHENN